jgi:hypothetical protein
LGLYYQFRENAGIFFQWQIDIQIPRLEKKNVAEQTHVDGLYEPTIYLTGGKMFKINMDISFNTSMLMRAKFNAPVSVGAYVSAELYTLSFSMPKSSPIIFTTMTLSSSIKSP